MIETSSQIIERPIYLDRIKPYIGGGLIKVLAGQRRVGKSYVLKSVEAIIRENFPDGNYITINLEDFAFSHIRDAKSLHDEIQTKISPGKKNFIFIDEIQEVDEFEKVVRSLNLNHDTDIYLTGSNSKMLSSEISTLLAGRSITFHIHPLSYKEYLRFHQLTDSDESLMEYLRFGGLPYLKNLPDKSTWNEYLSGIVDSIVYRDIVSRHSLRNNDFLSRLMLYLADNIGNIFTAKKIADYLKSQRISTSVTGVQSYTGYIEDAFIINSARRWDLVGKRFLEIGEKFYYEDLGMRNAIIGFRPNDIGGLMENAVYNHLRLTNHQVRIGISNDSSEIDFVAEKNGEWKYIQVAMEITSPSTAKREFGNLEAIADNYEKIFVTLHDSFPNTYNGIKTLTLRQFLLSE